LDALQVVKNVASTSLEIKKLVYIYLVHYAERCEENDSLFQFTHVLSAVFFAHYYSEWICKYCRRPDEALLSINSFQKDLSDLNPLVRGWSLRAMSGIRVRVVVPLVVMAVHKCSRDPSPYVRQCAAHAIPKIFALDREAHAEALEEVTVAAIIISFELGLSNFFQQRMMKIAT
jgi:AP-3 complex subunit beta